MFFSGKLSITQKLNLELSEPRVSDKILLKLPKPYAAKVDVYVNGSFVKSIIWRPFEADITDFVKPGDNDIKLVLYSSNRNLFGPHHHKNGEVYNPGSMSFTGNGAGLNA